MQKKIGLGKGLSALIPEKTKSELGKYKEIELTQIDVNPYQPRLEFSETELQALKESIIKEGLLQPILVLKKAGGYQLVAGERRLRAVRELKWERIPALILDKVQQEGLLLKSLVENLQRANLNPIEEAQAYKRMKQEFGYSLEKVAQEVGKDFSTVSNTMRLLNLPSDIQEDIKRGLLSPGHARALLKLKDDSKRRALLKEIKAKRINVREAEKRARSLKDNLKLDPNLRSILEKLQRKLGGKVELVRRKKGGRIEIHYLDEQDLERVIKILLSGEEKC